MENTFKEKISPENAAADQRYSDFIHPKYWPVWLALSVLWGISKLPMQAQHGIGRVVGLTAYSLLANRRHIASTNIKHCFPYLNKQAQRRLVRRTFESNAIALFEAASGWFSPGHRFLNDIKVSGLENVRQAQRSGRGIILLGGHYSTIDFAGSLCGQIVEAAAMQRDHDNPLFNRAMTQGRLKFCKKLFSKRDLRGAINWLKEGNVLWYATDQDFGRRASVFAPFFGIEATTLIMTSRIASKTDALVVPFNHFRTYKGSYELWFGEPLQDFPSSDPEDALLTNKILEDAIRLHPDQYLWLHRRFKTRPNPDEPKFYVK